MIIFYTTREGGMFEKAEIKLTITEVARRLDTINPASSGVSDYNYHPRRSIGISPGISPKAFVRGIPKGFFAILLPDGSIWDVTIGWDDEHLRFWGKGRYQEVQRIIKARREND